jgi:adenosylcobinamide kinase/adenosylcobinamide-phosphate guanylyltransferase
LPVTYLATCPRIDEETEKRIAAHIQRRPADWRCIEETVDAAGRIRKQGNSPGILLLDCLSLLLNNWMWEQEQNGNPDAMTEEQVALLAGELLQACREHPGPVVVVSSEVGTGIVPESKEIRQYRDWLGVLNQMVAAEADAVYAVIAGIPVNLKEIGTLL